MRGDYRLTGDPAQDAAAAFAEEYGLRIGRARQTMAMLDDFERRYQGTQAPILYQRIETSAIDAVEDLRKFEERYHLRPCALGPEVSAEDALQWARDCAKRYRESGAR